MVSTARDLTHCEGCDDEQPDVRRHRVTLASGEERTAMYCAACSELAHANFTGEILDVEEA